MAKFFEIAGGVVTPGIQTTVAQGQRVLALGEGGRGRKLATATLIGYHDVVAAQRPTQGWANLQGDRLASLEALKPGEEPGRHALVVVRDHAGFRGGWELLGAPIQRCPGAPDPDTYTICPDCGADTGGGRPHRLLYGDPPRVVLQGYKAQGDAGHMGGGAEYALLLAPGDGFSIRRSGRLYGAPAWITFNWDGATLSRAEIEEWQRVNEPAAIKEGV